jgi:hypothetical protein
MPKTNDTTLPCHFCGELFPAEKLMANFKETYLRCDRCFGLERANEAIERLTRELGAVKKALTKERLFHCRMACESRAPYIQICGTL